MIKLNDEQVPITVFPDGTHQVWKLTEQQMRYLKTSKKIEIFWEFENQSEVFDILQLLDLIYVSTHENPDAVYILNCPYFPYARQDKTVSNNSCFALNTFIALIMPKIYSWRCVDIHNIELLNKYKAEVVNTFPIDVVNSIISNENVDLIVFPDEGAVERYQGFVPSGINFISAQKSRDQLTGAILGITIDSETVNKASSVLVWDDICDGGGTFVGLASLIKVPKLMLYVSHGIFSKGTACLFSAGYNKLFTRKGQVQ